MESRTANLVLRLLQRHLPVPWPAVKQSQLPGLLPHGPLSSHAPGVIAAGRMLVESGVVPQGGQRESCVRFSEVEKNNFRIFFRQPNSPSLSLDRVSDAASIQPGPKSKISSAHVSGVDSPESVWGFKLGLRLLSGMYMPSQHEEDDLETSSVKRKRKKKMNKHKQRKLRRRDRHRN